MLRKYTECCEYRGESKCKQRRRGTLNRTIKAVIRWRTVIPCLTKEKKIGGREEVSGAEINRGRTHASKQFRGWAVCITPNPLESVGQEVSTISRNSREICLSPGNTDREMLKRNRAGRSDSSVQLLFPSPGHRCSWSTPKIGSFELLRVSVVIERPPVNERAF